MKRYALRGTGGTFEVDEGGIPVEPERDDYANVTRVNLDEYQTRNKGSIPVPIDMNKIGYWIKPLTRGRDDIYVDADDEEVSDGGAVREEESEEDGG